MPYSVWSITGFAGIAAIALKRGTFVAGVVGFYPVFTRFFSGF